MSRINDKITKAEFDFIQLVSRGVRSLERMRQTAEAKKLIRDRNALAVRILEAIDNAASVEDLIKYEIVLQSLDERLAQSPEDKASIENAQRDYRQLLVTVAQMRRNPYEYFQANIALRETGGDFRKMPRGRIEHIRANVTRLRNRASFAPEEEREIWDARLKLAEKTAEMLRALHKSLAKE